MIRIIDHEGNGYGAQAEITRRKGVNGEKSLTGVIYTNEEVLHGVDRGWKLEFENEMYAFTFAYPKDIGNRIELDFDAVHEFFYDMSKNSQNKLLSDGSHTFKTYLDFIFNGTDYNYRVDVDVSAFEKMSFGQRNRLDLFYDVIDTAGVEFSVNGSVVRILERVGNDLSTIVKKGFNLNELRLEKNIGNFVTYQKGFGAWNDDEDHSKGRLEVEYLSPLAEVYGKLDADPIVDERYTVKSNLENRLKSNVEGSYQISVQIDMEDLTRAGYEYKQPHEGDSIMAINKDLGFQRKVRIVSYETDFDVEGNILDHRITCNSVGMVEESILSNNSIKNSIKELQTDLELTRKQVIEFNISADGKSTNYYGPIEPSPDDYKLRIGDTWFDSSGEDTIVKVWNGVEWRKSGADVDAIRREVEQAQQDIAEAQATADNAITEIEVAIDAAGFTSLSDSLTGIQQISQTAQSNAENALAHSLNAISDASTALSNSTDALSQVANIDVRVDDVEGTLELKADKQEVDTLSGIVDTHTLDIQANAEGLALKANQDTVDTLAGTVQSLGTEFDIVAGQVNSKVWNTDIETAIDGIEVGGRNLALGTTKEFNTVRVGSYSGSLTDNGVTSKYIYTLDELGVKSGDTLTVSMYVGESVEGYGGGFRIDDQRGGNRYSSYKYVKNDYVYETFTILEESTEIRIYTLGVSQNPEASDIYFLPVKELKVEKGNIATDWSLAPEDTLARFDHIETEWTQTFDIFSQTVSGIDGRVSKQEQTVSGIESIVYDPETGLSSLNTQLANLIQVAVTGEEMTGAISVLEDNLNLRLVAKDEVITQINASTEGILLQADKVQALADVIVDGKLTITDEFIAPNAQIDGAKIADATIGSAKIARLDVDKISGNRTEFVQSAWNDAVGGNVNIDGGGVRTVDPHGDTAYLRNGGLDFFDWQGRDVGSIGVGYEVNSYKRTVGIYLEENSIFKLSKKGNFGGEQTDNQSSVYSNVFGLTSSNDFYMNVPFYVKSHRLSSIQESGYNTLQIRSAGRWTLGAGTQTQLSGATGAITSHVTITTPGLAISGGGDHRLYDSDDTITLETRRFRVISRSGVEFMVGRPSSKNLSIFADLNMNGHTISNSPSVSDARLKDVYGTRTENDLEKLMKIEYVNFRWKDPEYGDEDLGFIAQQVQGIAPELITKVAGGMLGFSQTTYVNFIGHAVQQLALRELNTNQVASQALQATETNAQKIERLEKRIEELESAA